MICGNTQIIVISFITWRACEDLDGTIEIAEMCHCHEFGTYNLNITHQSWLGVNFVMWRVAVGTSCIFILYCT